MGKWASGESPRGLTLSNFAIFLGFFCQIFCKGIVCQNGEQSSANFAKTVKTSVRFQKFVTNDLRSTKVNVEKNVKFVKKYMKSDA